jgi:hypothetical protein
MGEFLTGILCGCVIMTAIYEFQLVWSGKRQLKRFLKANERIMLQSQLGGYIVDASARGYSMIEIVTYAEEQIKFINSIPK